MTQTHDLLNDALSDWRPTRNAADLAHDLLDRLDDDERERLLLRGLTDEVRAHLRRKIDGVPVYTNVDVVNADGSKVRHYKQTELFDLSDYETAVRSYRLRADANLRVADALVVDCQQRLGIRLRGVA